MKHDNVLCDLVFTRRGEQIVYSVFTRAPALRPVRHVVPGTRQVGAVQVLKIVHYFDMP